MIKLTKNVLRTLNLTEAQALVYMAALELGEATMQEIARKSGVKRTSIYNFIDELAERGLITKTRKRKRALYSALHPEHIIEIEKTRIKELEHLLPQLTAIYNKAAHKPKVTFYEGRDGIYEVYMDTLKEKKPIVAWSDFDYMERLMGKRFMEEYPKERSRRAITFACITRDTETARELEKRDYGHLREMKFVNTGEFETEINIYGNKVALMSFRSAEPFAVLIEDEGSAKTLRVAWEKLWERL